MAEPGQRHRHELAELSGRLSVYLVSALVFSVVYAVADALDAERLFAGYPRSQLYILLACLAALGLVVSHRLFRLLKQRRRVRLLRDANIAIGHQLRVDLSAHAHIYHDVETRAGVIDHVALAGSGVFAFSVLPIAPRSKVQLRLRGQRLEIGPHARTISTVECSARRAAFEQVLGEARQRDVRVRSVIAVPGSNVETENGGEHLLVSENSLAGLFDAPKASGALCVEDIEAIRKLLDNRYRQSSRWRLLGRLAKTYSARRRAGNFWFSRTSVNSSARPSHSATT